MQSMMNMMKRTAGVAACAGLGLGLAACSGVMPLEQGSAVVTSAATPGVMDVRTQNGSVEIRRADVPEVVISATIKARTRERVEATRVVAEPTGTGMSVRVEWPDGVRHGNEGCSLVIQTPGAGGVAVDTSNGSVTIAGLSGRAEVDTSNGAIAIADHTGDVHADTSNGAITLERVTGEVVVDTSNGRIRLVDVGGKVRADTSNGGIVLEQAAGNACPFELTSSNGSVTVIVSDAFAGEVDASTSNGGVRILGATMVNGSRHSATARFACITPVEGAATAAAGTSVVRTSNGSVDVRR